MPLIYHFRAITAPHDGSWAIVHAKNIYNHKMPLNIYNLLHQISNKIYDNNCTKYALYITSVCGLVIHATFKVCLLAKKSYIQSTKAN